MDTHFTLEAPPAPAAREVVLSPTRIKAALACPRQHHLIYVERKPQTKPADMWQGLAVHRVLAAVNRAAAYLDGHLDPGRIIRDRCLVEGVPAAMAEAIVRHFAGGVGQAEGVEVKRRERVGAHLVEATADRLSPHEVVEYKSGGTNWAAWRLQAAILASLFGRPVRVVNLESAAEEVVTAETLPLTHLIDEAAQVVATKDATPRPLPAKCARCPVSAHCPSRA